MWGRRYNLFDLYFKHIVVVCKFYHASVLGTADITLFPPPLGAIRHPEDCDKWGKNEFEKTSFTSRKLDRITENRKPFSHRELVNQCSEVKREPYV